MQIGKGLLLLLISGTSLLLASAYLGGIYLNDYECPYAEVIAIPGIQAVLEPVYKTHRSKVPEQGEYAEAERAPRNWKLNGEVRRLSLSSEILKAKLKFNVYLPPFYEDKVKRGERFPTCYFFHGGDKGYLDNWVTDRRGVASAHSEIAQDFLGMQGITQDLILVSPDRATVGYFHNQGRSRWGDVICLELIPYIDSSFSSNKIRLVSGLCNGGNSAFCLAMQFPQMFDYVGSTSGFFNALMTKENKQKLATFRGIWFDVGTGEGMCSSNIQMQRFLNNNDIRFGSMILKGYGHDFGTWSGHPYRILPYCFGVK